MVALRYLATPHARHAANEAPAASPQAEGPVLERRRRDATFDWALTPYGCAEPDCARCHAGLAHGEGPGEVVVQHKRVQAVLDHLHDLAAQGDRAFAEHRVLLGTRTDPWQPAEREHHLTRALLERLQFLPGLDLRITTCSAIAGRDVDLLAAIARRGQVRVTVRIATLERRVWTALEPEAPSPERRLMAIELLRRAHVPVGVEVGPLLHGVNDSAAQLESLLERAQYAGATFAQVRPLALAPHERERLLAEVGHHHPAQAGGLRRLLGRSHLLEGVVRDEAIERFEATCARLHLPLGEGERPRSLGGEAGPLQLSLF